MLQQLVPLFDWMGLEELYNFLCNGQNWTDIDDIQKHPLVVCDRKTA
jgi:hypothetical protein